MVWIGRGLKDHLAPALLHRPPANHSTGNLQYSTCPARLQSRPVCRQVAIGSCANKGGRAHSWAAGGERRAPVPNTCAGSGAGPGPSFPRLRRRRARRQRIPHMPIGWRARPGPPRHPAPIGLGSSMGESDGSGGAARERGQDTHV